MLRRTLLLLCAVAMTACTSFVGDPHVFVASTPPGADILVDGESTGLTTPALLDLGGFFSGDKEITLELAGHEPETRWVRHHSTTATSRWGDGADENLLGWTWPLWWTLGDFFVPFDVRWRFTPHEVHAVLYEQGNAPVHSTQDR